MDRQTVTIPLHQRILRPMRSWILSKSIREWIQKRYTAGLDVISKGVGTLWKVKSFNTLDHP